MAHRRSGLAVMLVLAGLACAPAKAPAQQRQTPLVALAAERDFAPAVTRDIIDVRVPVRVRSGVRRSSVVVELIDVQPAPAAVESGAAFTVRPSRRGLAGERPSRGGIVALSGRGPAIVMRVDTRLTPPGTYAVNLIARRSGSARRTERTTLLVTIRLAAPTLRVRSSVRIERVVGPGHGDAGELVINERSGRARAAIRAAEQVEMTSDAGTVTGHVEAAGLPKTLPAGATLRLPVHAKGDFPVGVSTGSLELETRGLEPVSVAVEVKTKRSTLWLWLALILGLLLGFVTRQVLQSRLTMLEARGTLGEVARRAEDERAKSKDAEFIAAVTLLLGRIKRDLMAIDDATKLTEAAKAYGDELAELLAGVAERKKAADEKITSRARSIGVIARVPTLVEQEVRAVCERLGRARDALTAEDVGGAEAQLGSAEQQWEDAVVPTVEAWRAAAVHLTTATEATALPAARPAAVEAAGVLASIDGDGDWRPLLESVGRAQAAVDKTLLALHNDLEAAEQALGEPEIEDAERDALRVLHRRVGETVKVALESYETAPLETAATQLDERNALVSSATAVDSEELRSEVVQLTDSPEYQLRAELARGRLAAAATVSRAPSGEWSAALDLALLRRAAPVAPVAPPVVEARPAVDEDDPGSVAWAKKQRRKKRATSFLQSLLLTPILFFIGLELFDDAYVGTIEQLLAAFLWAYGIDLSVTTVMTAARTRGQPPATSATGTTPAPSTTA